MEDNKDILDEFGKRKKPSVPEGFFEEFSENLMNKISEEKSELDSITKSRKPEVPADFFENFAANISAEVSKDETVEEKPSRIISLKVMGFVTAVAACLLVMFVILPSDEEAGLADAETEEIQVDINLAETVTDDEYLAFLDGDDVVAFIIDNEDIAIDEDISSEEDEDVFYYLEEELEDYYLEEL